MNTVAPTFEKDQMVKWSPNRPEAFMVQSYGEGPFKVVSVEDVPTDCNCGLPKEWEERGSEHDSECQINLVNKIGHPQWVIIETPNGPKHLSGGFLAPA